MRNRQILYAKKKSRWYTQYPLGVPYEVNLEGAPHMADLLEQACARFAPQTAFEAMGARLTYKEFLQNSRYIAAYFQQALDLKVGDHIGFMLPNIISYPVGSFAALRAGLVVVNVNPLCSEQELAYFLRNAEVKVLCILEQFAHKLSHVLEQHKELQVEVIVARAGDFMPLMRRKFVHFFLHYLQQSVPAYTFNKFVLFRKALQAGKKMRFTTPAISLQHTAVLQYTGGTTGHPKAAVLSHKNIVSNVLQMALWQNGLFVSGKEMIVTILPLYHSFAFTCNYLFGIHMGMHNLLITRPKPVREFLRRIAKKKFSIITGVPPLYKAMMETSYFKYVDFSGVKMCMTGGMHLEEQIARKWQKKTGCELIMGYGLSELSPGVTFNPVGNNKLHSIGLPIPSTDVKVVGEDNQEVSVGEEGELCVYGPQTMQGYWRSSSESEPHFWRQKYFRTGDIGKMDKEGFFYIIDRKKEMVIVSGLKVYPSEVENVLLSHPKIQEAVIIGVPDKNKGECVHAFIIRKAADIEEEEVRKYCRELLSPYKVPRKVHFVQDFPRTPLGKVLKRMLKVQR